jgi:hypothetical protein
MLNVKIRCCAAKPRKGTRLGPGTEADMAAVHAVQQCKVAEYTQAKYASKCKFYFIGSNKGA